MRRIFVSERMCRGQRLRYHLLAEEREDQTETYGVQAEGLGETAAVRGLTSSQREAWALLEALYRGGVTPVALGDVVEDWLLR